MSRLIALLLCFPMLAQASIESGTLAGFRLGDQFSLSGATLTKIMGDRSVRIIAASPELPADADLLHVYATPGSYTIGKIIIQRWEDNAAGAERLAGKLKARWESKYPEWESLQAPVPFGKSGGAMVARLVKGPYALVIFYRPVEERYAVSVELEFESRSPERKAWKQQIAAEATDSSN